MVNPFQIIAERLGELGFYNFFLPWLITTAVFWGLLKKSELFKNVAVEATISLTVSFFLWGYLSGIAGAELGFPFSRFITQISLLIIMMVFALVGASMFYPEFMDSLKEIIGKNPAMLWVPLIIGFILFLMSGMLRPIGELFPTGDVGILILIFTFLFIGLIIATIARGQ